MHILLTAATPFELSPASQYLEKSSYRAGNHAIKVTITGIGSMITAYSLTKAIYARRPDFIIQAGIAGSFDANLLAPQVVIVKEELLADLGAAEKQQFSDVFDLGLINASGHPFENKRLINHTDGYGLPLVTGITVNEISTAPERIEWLKQKHQPSIESMEGAALHYVALMENIPFLQLRAISNRVGERDKQHWKMKEAIVALNETLINLLPQL